MCKRSFAFRHSFATIERTRCEASVDVGVANRGTGPLAVRMAISATASNSNEFAEVTCPCNPPEPGVHWAPCVMPFNATADNTTLSIYGIAGMHYIGIDRVSVQCVAPLGRHVWCGSATIH